MKKRIELPFVVLLVIGAAILVRFYISHVEKVNMLRQKQENLAYRLGVKLGDYANASNFPVEYFYAVLKPGMTYAEVHTIVQGYDEVINCFGTVEVYTYFASSGDDAIRFMLSYDYQGNYTELEGENPRSRTLPDNRALAGGACTRGLLGK